MLTTSDAVALSSNGVPYTKKGGDAHIGGAQCSRECRCEGGAFASAAAAGVHYLRRSPTSTAKSSPPTCACEARSSADSRKGLLREFQPVALELLATKELPCDAGSRLSPTPSGAHMSALDRWDRSSPYPSPSMASRSKSRGCAKYVDSCELRARHCLSSRSFRAAAPQPKPMLPPTPAAANEISAMLSGSSMVCRLAGALLSLLCAGRAGESARRPGTRTACAPGPADGLPLKRGRRGPCRQLGRVAPPPRGVPRPPAWAGTGDARCWLLERSACGAVPAALRCRPAWRARSRTPPPPPCLRDAIRAAAWPSSRRRLAPSLRAVASSSPPPYPPAPPRAPRRAAPRVRRAAPLRARRFAERPSQMFAAPRNSARAALRAPTPEIEIRVEKRGAAAPRPRRFRHTRATRATGHRLPTPIPPSKKRWCSTSLPTNQQSQNESKKRVGVGGPAADASRRPPRRASGWSRECNTVMTNERSNTRVCVTFPWVMCFTLCGWGGWWPDDDGRGVERRTARAGGLSVVRTVPPCGAPLGAPPRAAVRTGGGGRARAARPPPPPRRAAPVGTRGRDSEKGDPRLGSCASRVGGVGGQPCLHRACSTGGHRPRPR